ncbi:MAG: dimethylaniline monooxygenase [Saprospiraceae bacterium]|nr:MAG: dimethylaniline monooxygenase [Saprospiraceae bacterium]
MNHIQTPVLIIGAGPAGLATAGRLRHRQIPFEIIEQENVVGSTWHRHYDRLKLHTVKELSHLPYLPFPDHYPRYVSRQQLVDHFEAYAKHFQIEPHFGEKAINLQRVGDQWETTTQSGKTFLSEKVVITTGVNRVPFRPKFPNEKAFQGKMVHSIHYKNADPYRGQRVLVIGMGNTGAEIALDLCKNEVASFVSLRGPINIVPRDLFGRPTQLTALKLAQLPHWLGDLIAVVVRHFTIGNLNRYGIQTPKMPPGKQLRVLGKTPVIDLGTLKAIKIGRIKVLPDIEKFTATGALFKDGTHLDFDAAILATGYHPRIYEFLPGAEQIIDQHGIPEKVIGEGPYEGIYFIGFDNYTPGGILGVINRDTKIVVDELAKLLEVV